MNFLHSQSPPFSSSCTKPPVDQEIHEIFGFFPKHCMNHSLDHWIQLFQDVALLFLNFQMTQGPCQARTAQLNLSRHRLPGFPQPSFVHCTLLEPAFKDGGLGSRQLCIENCHNIFLFQNTCRGMLWHVVACRGSTRQ